MTDAEAESMLKQLTEHFNQPVMPIERYCEAFHTWFWAAGPYLKIDPMRMVTAIHKSNLLRRLIYQGEKLRTVKCPTHKGEWSGCSGFEPCDCKSGIDITGWLP